MSPEDRCEGPRYDPEIHIRHNCQPVWTEEIRLHVGKVIRVEHQGVVTHGRLLFVGRDRLVVSTEPQRDRKWILAATVTGVTFLPDPERREVDSTWQPI